MAVTLWSCAGSTFVQLGSLTFHSLIFTEFINVWSLNATSVSDQQNTGSNGKVIATYITFKFSFI